jgi:hypothetical protein
VEVLFIMPVAAEVEYIFPVLHQLEAGMAA